MVEAITIYAERGGCYFPVVKLSIEALQKQGFNQRFMLKYMGQIDQFISPKPLAGATPHSEMPEQPTNSSAGGNPALTSRTLVDQVTVFFATGHSKVLSSMELTPESIACDASWLRGCDAP